MPRGRNALNPRPNDVRKDSPAICWRGGNLEAMWMEGNIYTFEQFKQSMAALNAVASVMFKNEIEAEEGKAAQ